MAMLHTVNKSPFEKRSLDGALSHAVNDAGVLMFEDGIYGALKGTVISAKVEKSLATLKIYVLGPDLKARGMNEDQVIDGVTIIDYAGFVDLVTEYDKVQAWL